MRRVHQLLLIAAVCVGRTSCAFGCEFVVSNWQVVPVPEDQHSAEFALWRYGATNLEHQWTVYRDGKSLCARLLNRQRRKDPFLPFVASVESFQEAVQPRRVAVPLSDFGCAE
jgi:hypothetical protein